MQRCLGPGFAKGSGTAPASTSAGGCLGAASGSAEAAAVGGRPTRDSGRRAGCRHCGRRLRRGTRLHSRDAGSPSWRKSPVLHRSTFSCGVHSWGLSSQPRRPLLVYPSMSAMGLPRLWPSLSVQKGAALGPRAQAVPGEVRREESELPETRGSAIPPAPPSPRGRSACTGPARHSLRTWERSCVRPLAYEG